jgi:hypothetical protein
MKLAEAGPIPGKNATNAHFIYMNGDKVHRGLRAYPLHCQLSVGRQGLGSLGICIRPDRIKPGRAPRRLDAGYPRLARRSPQGPAHRVTSLSAF